MQNGLDSDYETMSERSDSTTHSYSLKTPERRTLSEMIAQAYKNQAGLERMLIHIQIALKSKNYHVEDPS